MTTSRIATGLAVIVCAFAAGCGGDDSDDGGGGGEAPATDITKAEFVKQANAICTAGNQEIADAAQELGSNGQPSDDDLQGFAEDSLIPSIRGQVEDIRALGFPEGDEDTLGGLLDDADGILDDAEDDPVAFVQQDEDPFTDVNQGLADYGVTACAG